MHHLHTSSESETILLGERLGTLLKGGDVVLLSGDLGAGKTRFVKGVARSMGTQTEPTSPTFNLVLEYPLESSGSEQHARTLRHFDLYRLESAEQLSDIDYFGLIEEDDAVSLVEWGSKFSGSLPLDYLHIEITIDEANPEQRALTISAEGARSHTLLEHFIREAA